MIKAIIFDCFGVLVGRGFDETYRTVGGNPDTDRRFVSDLLAQANHGLISQKDFSEQITTQLGISEVDWHQALKESELPNRELLDYIERLHENYKTAILSNANRGVVQGKLGQERLTQCFDEVIVSAEIGRVKPEQEMYKYAAESLEVELDECIFLDDLEGFVKAAEAIGMHGIVYKNVDQAKQAINRLLG
jgi:putative hydrolase of the HAD superfamily